ncbi:hypothetical protein EPA93_18165 [Ktedonosporobacter rubrisoli]|uniref:Uncharacterized protein n=1 Tax=Ktedonosporobacter rubrisoli TaxID=2509675 RepID=A0A4P6JR61_KTERU|nr:hypothetical protein [Ktedonosporobacter rubrisoli]QBD77814.1 hypothetical protein EPA93_18165 [Ktedonosporobacter rubrisoli]
MIYDDKMYRLLIETVTQQQLQPIVCQLERLAKRARQHPRVLRSECEGQRELIRATHEQIEALLETLLPALAGDEAKQTVRYVLALYERIIYPSRPEPMYRYDLVRRRPR